MLLADELKAKVLPIVSLAQYIVYGTTVLEPSARTSYNRATVNFFKAKILELEKPGNSAANYIKLVAEGKLESAIKFEKRMRYTQLAMNAVIVTANLLMIALDIAGMIENNEQSAEAAIKVENVRNDVYGMFQNYHDILKVFQMSVKDSPMPEKEP